MRIDLLVYFSFIHSFVLRSLKLHFPVFRFGLGVGNRVGLITMKGADYN